MIGIDTPNEISAIVALAIMALVTRGYAPLLRFRWAGHDYASLMAFFIAGVGLVICARLAFWDVIVPLLGYLGAMPPRDYTLLGQIANTVFNTWAAVCGLVALAALHRSLPIEERGNYNWLTAPFYPRGGAIRILWWRKS